MAVAEERGVTKAFAKVCPCEACKKGRFEPHKIAFGTIHGYSTAPAQGWKPEMTLAEKRAMSAGSPKPFFLGVELETMVGTIDEFVRQRNMENDLRGTMPPSPAPVDYGATNSWGEHMNQAAANRFYAAERTWFAERAVQEAAWMRAHPRPVEKMSAEEATSLARPRNFWHPKHDGSVTGPEFASRPASLDWWYSRRPSLEAMFTGLLHGGLRSHQGDKAGMHVNISMTAFENAAHLSRFAALINTNKTWARRMSQRTEHSTSWARLGQRPFDNDHDRDQWARRTCEEGEGWADRYNALNTPGMGRIEFRLPRGTLRIDRFYKNLEWTHAMIAFTRQYGDKSSAVFMRWVMAREEYPDLRAFLMERFGISPQSEFAGSPISTLSLGMTRPIGPDVLCEYVAPRIRVPLPARSRVYGLDPAIQSVEDDERVRAYRDGRCPCGDGCDLGGCDSCYPLIYELSRDGRFVNSRVEAEETEEDYDPYPWEPDAPDPAMVAYNEALDTAIRRFVPGRITVQAQASQTPREQSEAAYAALDRLVQQQIVSFDLAVSTITPEGE